MEQDTSNRLYNSTIDGNYIGGNLNIVLYKDEEREFVVTRHANIKPVYYFTGRELELQDLHQKIESRQKSVLVSGMGGIGKTHICKRLFQEYEAIGENGAFKHIGYVEYNGNMGNSLQECLRYKEQERPEANQEAAWQELEHLASDGKLLLFVDNVNKTIREDPGLGRLNSIPGAVILTSRLRMFSKEFEPYRIGFLNIEQCREIYERIRFEDSGKKVTKEEVPDLEYIIDKLAARHTITIEFLAYWAWTKHWSVKRLKEKLEQNGFCLEYRDEQDKLVNIQKSYEILYDLSELSAAEQNILEAFSVFPYIPLQAKVCNQWLLSDAGVSEDDDILMGLYQKGWLQFDIEQESYALHPVFAQFIYEKVKPSVEMHPELMEACRKCLEIPESGSALECQKFIPFAENILKKIDMKESGRQATFMTTFAYLFNYIAEYEKAKNLYEKSLIIYKRILGESHPEIVISYSNLAAMYGNLGEYEKARKLYKKNLKFCKKAWGEIHPNTAKIYNNLAYVYDSLGEYKKAKKLYKKSLEICKRVFKEEHPDIARSYNNLALVYDRLGKYEKAKKLHEKSLEIREKVLDKEHPETASSYNNLALVYCNLGEYEKGLDYYFQAYKAFMSKLGLNHQDTQLVYKNMKVVYNEWNPEGDFNQWLEERIKL